MKLLLMMLFASAIYTTDCGYYNDATAESQYRRIGYTTNYSNGQFNSTYYSSPRSTEDCVNYYGSSGIRRIKGYTADGDSIDTGSSTKGNPDNMWEYGYHYYYDNGYWYRYDGSRWWKWGTVLDWDILGWRWRDGRNPGGNPIEYYKDPPTPSTPLGDGTVPMIGLLLLYKFQKSKRSHKRSSNFFILYT